MFWTADLLVTNLILTVDVHKLECLVKRLPWGQGHSEGSEPQWMFAQKIYLIDET